MALGNNPTPNELVKEVKEISSNYVKETITENNVATGILNRGEEGLRAGTSTTLQSQEPYQSLMLNANIEDQSIRLEATTEENTTLIGASSEGRAVVAVVDNSEGEMIAGIVADSEGNVAIGGTSLTFNESNVALEDDVPVESGTGKDSVKNKTPYDETDVDSHGNVIDRTNTVAGNFSAAFGSRNNIGAGSSETFVTGGKNTITHTEDALVSGYENTVSSSHQSIIGGYDNNVKASESVVVGEGNTVDGTITGASYKTDTRTMAVFGNSNSVGINNKHSLIAGEDNEMGINGKWNFEVGAHHDVGRNNECVNVLGWTNTTNGYLTDSTLAGYDNTAYGGASGNNTFSVYMLGHSNDNQDPSDPSKGLSEVYQIGHGLLAKHRGQVILGKYNRGNVSEVNDILTVGCGTSSNSRSNCFGTGNNGTDNYIRVGTTPLTESKLSDLVNNAVTNFEVDGNTFSSNNSVELKTINGDYDGLHNKLATGNDISGKEDSSNKVTSISNQSTDTQYPSAKCVYDAVGNAVEMAEGKTANYVISDATTGTNVVNTSFNSTNDTVAIEYTDKKITDVEGNDINLSDLKIGDIVSVTETEVPDRWVGSITTTGTPTITFYKLETKLNIDSSPTNGSTNPVSSGGVYTALGNKQDTIDSSHKLSADLIADGTTNKAFTATEQTKLSNIESGAQANVQSDWNQSNSSADDYIKNKPTIPTVNDSTITITQGGVTKGSFTLNQSSGGTIALDAGGGTATDVQVDDVSQVVSGVANLKTKNGNYNASTNKLVTESDLPNPITITTTSGSESISDGTSTLSFGANAFNSTTIPTPVIIETDTAANGSPTITSSQFSDIVNAYKSGKSVLLRWYYAAGSLSTPTYDYYDVIGVKEMRSFVVGYDIYIDMRDSIYIIDNYDASTYPNLHYTRTYYATRSGNNTFSGTNNFTGTFQIGGKSLLDIEHPINSLYASVDNTSPASLFGGTWAAFDEGYALWTTTTANTGGAKISAGLPNIKGTFGNMWNKNTANASHGEGAFSVYDDSTYNKGLNGSSTNNNGRSWSFNAHNSNSIYADGNTTVQPPAIKIYVWRRTA